MSFGEAKETHRRAAMTQYLRGHGQTARQMRALTHQLEWLAHPELGFRCLQWVPVYFTKFSCERKKDCLRLTRLAPKY
jgi:hypothetical protein